MKLQPDRFNTLSVQAHGPGWVVVNGEKHEHSVLISSEGALQAWGCAHPDELTPEHFARLGQWRPELVVYGSGSRIRFPAPALLRPLIEQGIGVETMDSLAAARTYNILAGEGRRVVAALILESPK
jgi:uncharacterized protein